MEKSSFNATMDAVVAGRACLLSYFGQIKHIEEKDKAAGLVSEADRESEKIIKNMLAEAFPDYDFLGEETSYLEGDTHFQKSVKTTLDFRPFGWHNKLCSWISYFFVFH